MQKKIINDINMERRISVKLFSNEITKLVSDALKKEYTLPEDTAFEFGYIQNPYNTDDYDLEVRYNEKVEVPTPDKEKIDATMLERMQEIEKKFLQNEGRSCYCANNHQCVCGYAETEKAVKAFYAFMKEEIIKK